MVNGRLSDPFVISSGVRQGCVLAPSLFNTTIDTVLNDTVNCSAFGATYSENMPPITDLDFADDAALLAESFEVFHEILTSFSDSAVNLGLQVSRPKTKLQVLSPWLDPPNSLTIGGHSVDYVNTFTYLGSVIDQGCSSAADVRRRSGLATSVFGRLSSVWKSHRLSLSTKLKLYNTLVLSVVLYGASTWTLTVELKRQLDVFDTRAQRRILGLRWFDFVSNNSLRARTKQIPLSVLIRQARHRLCGHIARFPPQSDVRRLAFSNPPAAWKRPPGRPPARWLDQLSRDVNVPTGDLELMAQRREEWKKLSQRSPTPGARSSK